MYDCDMCEASEAREASHAGKTVLVTGSSRGIGFAIAKAFAEKGYKIVINANKSERELQTALSALKRVNRNVISCLCDVSDYDAVYFMFEEIKKTFGTVDILVNNAGTSLYGLFQEQTPKEWEHILNVNFKSVLNCSRLAIPEMIDKRSGAIINISSVWGQSGASCEAVYAASKAAIDTFTKSIAKELATSGITANAISCGVIDTDMNKRFTTEEISELRDRIPASRLGLPSEIAETTLFLASNGAKYLTGQIIGVNGGFF